MELDGDFTDLSEEDENLLKEKRKEEQGGRKPGWRGAKRDLEGGVQGYNFGMQRMDSFGRREIFERW